jgi:asparagine synthase (glutamine-hydrolysing)
LFAALFNADGRPINHTTLSGCDRLVESPDGAPHVALVWSPPKSAVANGEWRGMENLQGRYWIAGRLRFDARDELCRRLADSVGLNVGVSDATLCLHAYALWGISFIERLAGDFSFVLWDGERRRLLALRDRLGVRALFHAQSDGAWYISDSLDWILATAPLEGEFDDFWIADFLSVGYCIDFERTAYRHVNRLAPAHLLDCSSTHAAVRRYWRLELGEPLYFRDRRTYVERFLELITLSIADRLPSGKVGISMSGGLDSTTLAACAVNVTGDPSRIVAECTHFERLMVDDEKHFAMAAAGRLGIELELKAIDDLTYDPSWRTRTRRSAEPYVGIVCAHPDRLMAVEQASRAPVWFFGEGPDDALAFDRDAYFSWLVKRRDWRRLAEAALLYLKAKGGDGWGETARRYVSRRAADTAAIEVPPWLDRGLVDKVALGERLHRVSHEKSAAHPWHPSAVASFSDAIWPALFASFDDEETLAPIAWRHPYLDLRVLEFLLMVPPVPWARRKLLLREAMRGRLPDAILARRKTPLAESPAASPIAAHGLPALSSTRQLARYVDLSALPKAPLSGSGLDRLIAVHALDHWLGQLT